MPSNVAKCVCLPSFFASHLTLDFRFTSVFLPCRELLHVLSTTAFASGIFIARGKMSLGTKIVLRQERSQKDTQTPRRINISTPSVADVRSNNSNNIDSSTSTPPAIAHRCMRTHTIAVEQRPVPASAALARQVAVRRSAGALARARTATCPFFF